jgi:molybdenum cofactor cytidylyltransferase
MGVPKATLKAGTGRTFLASVARTLKAAGADLVLVVVGAHAAEISAHARSLKLRVVRNPRWASGQLSSARVGLRTALRLRARQIVLCPVDLPRVRNSTARRLMRSARAHPDAIVVPEWRGEPGHPVVIPRTVARRALMAMRPPSLRHALLETRAAMVHLPVADAGVADVINTPLQYRTAFGENPHS